MLLLVVVRGRGCSVAALHYYKKGGCMLNVFRVLLFNPGTRQPGRTEEAPISLSTININTRLVLIMLFGVSTHPFYSVASCKYRSSRVYVECRV